MLDLYWAPARKEWIIVVRVHAEGDPAYFSVPDKREVIGLTHTIIETTANGRAEIYRRLQAKNTKRQALPDTYGNW